MLKLLLNGMGVYISIMHSFCDRPLFGKISTTRVQNAYHLSKSWLVRLLILLVAILLCSNTNTNMQAKCSISFLVAKKVVVSFSTTSVEEIISVEERSLIISHKESLRVSSLSFLSEEEDCVPHLCLVRCFQQNDTMQPQFSVWEIPPVNCKGSQISRLRLLQIFCVPYQKQGFQQQYSSTILQTRVFQIPNLDRNNDNVYYPNGIQKREFCKNTFFLFTQRNYSCRL